MSRDTDRSVAALSGGPPAAEPGSPANGIRLRVLVPVGLAIVFLLGAFVFMSVRDTQHRRADDIARSAKSVDDLLRSQLSEGVQVMSSIMQLILRDRRLEDALRARDRDALLAISSPILKDIRARNRITHFYYILPDRTMLLRVQVPDEWGDKIERFVLQEAQRTGKPYWGNEQGPFGSLTLRVTYPWYGGNGQVIGYLEMGIEFEDIMNTVHKLLDVDVFVAIDKQFLNREKWDRMQKKLGRNADWDEFPSTIVLSRTSPAIPRPIASYIAGLGSTHVKRTAEVEWDGRIAQSIMLPFIDLRGRELGEIVVLRDVTAAADDARRALATVVVACLLVGGTLLVFFYVLLGRVQRGVAQRTVRLAEMVVAKDRAEVANRAKSAFLASMSHELRTPLNAILGYAQILKRDQGLSERQRKGLGTIQQGGEHLLTLVNDILDLAKVEAGRLDLTPESTDLESFLHVVCDIVRVKADEKDLRFVHVLPPRLPPAARFDDKRLRQVLINLLSNAMKFTDQGQVSLHVSLLPSIEGVSRLRFEVQDTGPGIAPEQLETIFEPFEQVGDTRRRAGGTGLGLAISRQLVRLMGSEIHVDSQLGQGSRFWFELEMPVVDWGSLAAPEQQAVIGYEGPRKKVLVVDDIAGNRAVLIDWLASLGFAVGEAENGEHLLAQATALRPDLIITDILMPQMDGFEATRRLRQLAEFDGVPVIMVSASASNADQERGLAVGAQAFLSKPIELGRLLRQIEALLKLTWIAEQPLASQDTEQLLAPEQDELEALYQLARMGNMRRLRESADRLSSLDEKYRPFAGRLLWLADRFQSRAILELIARYRVGDTTA